MSSTTLRIIALALGAAGLAGQAQAAAITLTDGALAYQQNFDSLAKSGTSSSLPAGWSFLETLGNANTSYAAGTGSDNAGNTYSFGSAGSSERALGGLQSGNLLSVFGASFTNQASRSVASVAIAYVGEQWRLGASGRNDRLNFQYSTNASSLSTGTWTDVDALDFVSPISTGSARALDGNLAANSRSLNSSLNGLNLAQGATLWLRWNDFNASGADDGLAVDNFSLNATLAPVPEPGSYALLLAGLGVVGLVSRRRLGR
ncbi:PEP-CTERM sorting domain-containing protein [Roseateles sp. DAIF2]|uniref:PEP-CTERM sorting domain-containing protein n=1 Tax=Roseateles sp. DAIF2 TaxID=2714952 RepID=UPI0018A27DAE|nr:PEP-CTERM sorting domain-containing protein [Roseateles sp. DAIF2]QPF76199.1 PEP-CTERM sorting domain-containing protein [Roseateles sp. DAIF2]